jgi:hypothetical protein
MTKLLVAFGRPSAAARVSLALLVAAAFLTALVLRSGQEAVEAVPAADQTAARLMSDGGTVDAAAPALRRSLGRAPAIPALAPLPRRVDRPSTPIVAVSAPLEPEPTPTPTATATPAPVAAPPPAAPPPPPPPAPSREIFDSSG